MTLNTNEFTGSNAPPADSPESLDQVRDILFGGQMKMVDARLQALETRLQQEHVAMRAEYNREVSDLDASLKHGIAQLNERLAEERSKRVEGLKVLSADMKALVKNLEQRHQALEEAASQADAELRDQLLRQSAAQAAELTRTADQPRATARRRGPRAGRREARHVAACLRVDRAGEPPDEWRRRHFVFARVDGVSDAGRVLGIAAADAARRKRGTPA